MYNSRSKEYMNIKWTSLIDMLLNWIEDEHINMRNVAIENIKEDYPECWEILKDKLNTK